MLQFITRWPAWYLVLAAYCIYLSVGWFRHFREVSAGLASTSADRTTPQERRRAAGYRAGVFCHALAWTVGGLGLLTGAAWVRAMLALAFLVSSRSAFVDYATGFAGGRKAAELLAAPEYVMGRVKPTVPDFAAAAVYVALARILPLGATLYAMWKL